MLRSLAVLALVAGAAVGGAVGLGSERGGEPTAVLPSPARGEEGLAQNHNTPYDGSFTFVRLRFTPSRGGFFGGREPPWAHDYPRAERNLMRILDEITQITPFLGGGNVLTADDPELFKYPVAYICEPGYWTPTDAEVEGLRNYLLKGGFLIVDDFRGDDLYNFEVQIRRVLPDAQLVELDVSHPVFNSFFEIHSLDFSAPTFRQYRPVYFGIFEDNDPAGRLLAVVNYNNDIGDYWEWSDVGFMPIELSNEAYKLGVNYIVYAMTH
ncbi:MAG TPA: DUF4159 domain-containing protein [Longimicrobiaceae bacterium]|nr:DUF4159 domain-containing protein [Longimicrobiaceae bacterium]